MAFYHEHTCACLVPPTLTSAPLRKVRDAQNRMSHVIRRKLRTFTSTTSDQQRLVDIADGVYMCLFSHPRLISDQAILCINTLLIAREVEQWGEWFTRPLMQLIFYIISYIEINGVAIHTNDVYNGTTQRTPEILNFLRTRLKKLELIKDL